MSASRGGLRCGRSAYEKPELAPNYPQLVWRGLGHQMGPEVGITGRAFSNGTRVTEAGVFQKHSGRWTVTLAWSLAWAVTGRSNESSANT